MTFERRRLVGVAMAARAGQWRTRCGIGVVIAMAFFSMTGVAFAASWLAIYCALQVLELHLFKADKQPARSVPDVGWCWAAVAFIALNNFAFGAFAAREAFSDNPLGMAVAALLIAGAIVNGVIVSAGSRFLTWASIGPQILCFSALAFSTASVGESPLQTAQIAAGSLLFVLAAVAASHQLAVKLKIADEARLEQTPAEMNRL